MLELNNVDSNYLKPLLSTKFNSMPLFPLSSVPLAKPVPKRRRVAPCLRPLKTVDVKKDLGTYIKRDVELLRGKGWHSFVQHPCGRRPRVNNEALSLALKAAMQFGHALDRILWEIILADLSLGPVYLSKLDISNGFFSINLAIEDIPHLGVVFMVKDSEQEPLVAFPLIPPMGWANSLPIFSAATETVANLANNAIAASNSAPKHPLDDLAAPMDDPVPPSASNCARGK